MREQFIKDLEALKRDLYELGHILTEALSNMQELLDAGDLKAVERTFALEDKVAALEEAVESRAMLLLLSQQPVATDLRNVTAAMRMNRDLSRMHIICIEWMKLYMEYYRQIAYGQIPHMKELCKEVREMAEEAFEAYKILSKPVAEHAIEGDKAVDGHFDKLKITIVQGLKDDVYAPGPSVNALLMGKYFEKLGDHAKSFAYQTIYIITGQPTEAYLFPPHK